MVNNHELLAFVERQAAATTGDTQRGWRYIADEIATHMDDAREPYLVLWMTQELDHDGGQFQRFYADVVPALAAFVEQDTAAQVRVFGAVYWW